MSDKIRVLIVDDLPETRENVRKLLQFESDVDVIAQAGTGEQAVELAEQHVPDIILMDINMPGLDGIGASQAIMQSVPSTQIIIMSVQSEADYLRRAMLAGARDFLMKPFSGDELITAIRRVHQMRPSTPAAVTYTDNTSGIATAPEPTVRKTGFIVALYSPKGGSGCTTIAINFAVALSDKKQNVLLVDGSLQFGNVDVMLNMKPTTSIVDFVDRVDELDSDLVSSVAIKHKSGLKVLLAPPRPEMADLVTDEHIKQLFEQLRRNFDFIVVDMGTDLNDRALAMLDSADRILLITEQNLPSLKNVSRFFDIAETLDYERELIFLVVNRMSKKAGISVKDIADTLKRPVMATIPLDEDTVRRAADQGTPFVTGRRRPVGDAITKMAGVTVESFHSNKAEPDLAKNNSRPSFLARLFGRG